MFWLRGKRRKRLMRQPFPDDWLEIIERNVLFYHYLSREKQRKLLGLVRVFLAEKRFEGCGGLQITDEIRITIAAQACILLLNLDADFYPKLRSILVYPDAFAAGQPTRRHGTARSFPGRLPPRPVPAYQAESRHANTILPYVQSFKLGHLVGRFLLTGRVNVDINTP